MEHLFQLVGALIVFGLIIVFHEFGHFIIAKLSGMTVHEFSMGFGPALLSKLYHGTLYSLRIIPLGGFVRIAGMDPEETETEDDVNGYNKKPFLAKFGTILAGATMNFVLALLIFIIIGMAIGYPKEGKQVTIVGIQPGAPAARVGVMAGDEIVAVNGKRHLTIDETRKLIRESTPPIQLELARNNKTVMVSVTPEFIASPERTLLTFRNPINGNQVQTAIPAYRITKIRAIGVSMDTLKTGEWERMGLLPSIGRGVVGVLNTMVDAFAQFVSLCAGYIPLNQLSGPVGIIRVSMTQAQAAMVSMMGMLNFLSLIALLSVFIGFFNLLPIPALDGSRLWFLVIEAIRGKPLDRKKEAMIHLVGMAILLGVMFLIIISDVLKWTRGKW